MHHYGSYSTGYVALDSYRSTPQLIQNQQMCITNMPLTPPGSHSRDSSTITDGQSDSEGGIECNSPSDNSSQVDGVFSITLNLHFIICNLLTG